jgi:hypothetical protein
MALLAGSPAIDQIPAHLGPPADQRGVARPVNTKSDIGAYEYGASLTASNMVLSISRTTSGSIQVKGAGTTVSATLFKLQPTPSPTGRLSSTNLAPIFVQRYYDQFPDSLLSSNSLTLQAMHRVVAKARLSPNVTRLDVLAPRISQIRQPGQFAIVFLGGNAERIPLTIADADPAAGTIALVIQAVGKSTFDLVALEPGQAIEGIAGPLGKPTELISTGKALCIGGGVGTAVVHPIAQGLHRRAFLSPASLGSFKRVGDL